MYSVSRKTTYAVKYYLPMENKQWVLRTVFLVEVHVFTCHNFFLFVSINVTLERNFILVCPSSLLQLNPDISLRLYSYTQFQFTYNKSRNYILLILLNGNKTDYK